MQDDNNLNDPRTPPLSTIKELVEKNNAKKPETESTDDDDDLFATPNATPNRVTKIPATGKKSPKYSHVPIYSTGTLNYFWRYFLLFIDLNCYLLACLMPHQNKR